MMNIRLLFRAHQLGGDKELYRKAVTHARTTEKYLVRKAGTRTGMGHVWIHRHVSVHEGRALPGNGRTLRGLLSRTHAGWRSAVLDYGAPNIPNEPLDSSAAAIAAGAFWKLKNISGTRRGAETYKRAALTILSTLTSKEFTGDCSREGILQ
jgi:hypothetical protein